MKTNTKLLVFFLFSFFYSLNSNAQVVSGMNYQAVIRNSSNALIANTVVGVKISIIETSATGTVVYSERHTPTTNANGLVTFVIGTGTVLLGDFFTINWTSGLHFIKTETDPTGGSTYTITNTSQLNTVPYSQFAENSLYASYSGDSWKKTGNVVDVTTDFIGSTNDVDVVFKRNNIKAGVISKNDNLSFGVGTLLNINSTASNNSAFGARALNSNISGFNNTAVGTNALLSNNADFNTAVGVGSSFANTSGTSNTSMGHFSLKSNIIGSGNVSIGNNSLENSVGFYNTALGYLSLFYTTGDQNVALGWRALENLTTGGGNIGIGKIVDVPSPTANNQLSIGNVIYGTNMGTTATGTIGIGVPVPTERLEVAGKTKTTNLQVTNGAGVNKVLTSDATGNANWTTSNTLPGTINNTVHINSGIKPSLPTAASTWEFVVATPTQVTLTANQRVVIAYNLSMGSTTTNTSNVELRMGAGYRTAGSGSAINTNGNDYVTINPMVTAGVYNAYAFSSSFKPGVAGTYEIGAIIRSANIGFFNLGGNSWISGYYMIINE